MISFEQMGQDVCRITNTHVVQIMIRVLLFYRFSSIKNEKASLRSEDELDLLRVPQTTSREEPDKVMAEC